MLYVVLALVILLLGFVAWRYTSVERGGRQQAARVLKILDPLSKKLEDREPIAGTEVDAAAAQASVRPMLYAMLKHYERLDLFPRRQMTAQAQAEAALAYWLTHPNEGGDAPAEIEVVETLDREVDGKKGQYMVLRFRMPDGHKQAKLGWQLGVAGPFPENGVPYSYAEAFARSGDRYGTTQPAELVDWYAGVRRKE